MKTIILCGGRGTRLGEHGTSVPKALIEIGGKPILWHLLKIYAHYGLKDFVLCLGFLGGHIKRHFIEHHWLDQDITLDMTSPHEYQIVKSNRSEDWRIAFVNTGLDTNTGGRVKRVMNFIGKDELFCVTYGDGLANVDIRKLIDFHRSHGKLATLTAVHPISNFGIMKLDSDGSVSKFQEKPQLKDWINGGFFVFDRRVFDYLDDNCILEREPLERLASERQLIAYQHTGFWKCMDTYKDNMEFNEIWNSSADWKVWQ
ncbi:MAG: glucose-1-phosphate cytidylyltransferase [Planctomycetes bacterium]|nr:glucose-1-phosphate cytidylyltransferase [Planctomycetota bacterium]